jgi:hypothetical protein
MSLPKQEYLNTQSTSSNFSIYIFLFKNNIVNLLHTIYDNLNSKKEVVKSVTFIK